MTSTTAELQSQQAPQEIISFRRRSEIPGIEVHTLTNSDRSWSRYCAEYEFLSPSTWQAQVWHRRREHLVTPGVVLCAQPGEVIAAKRVLTRGSAHALIVDAPTLQRYLAEHDVSVANLRLRSTTRMSNLLLHRLFEVFAAMRPGPSPLHIETGMAEFVASLVRELIDGSPQPLPRQGNEERAAARIRECLHDDPAVTIDLTTLSQHTGMSRFQVVRLFKRRYGLPPHTYQLQRRLVLAQKCLREGMRPAQVAAEHGFVDQSHLTRHFKRVLGITPAQYARGSKHPSPNDPPSVRQPELDSTG